MSQNPRVELLALSPQGQELWRFGMSDRIDVWVTTQPPIRDATGRTFVLTQFQVLAIEQGKMVWSFGTGNLYKGMFSYASLLGDGSLLVTFGQHLLVLNAIGEKIFDLELSAEIVSPPVVDSFGAVYVLTATELVKII